MVKKAYIALFILIIISMSCEKSNKESPKENNKFSFSPRKAPVFNADKAWEYLIAQVSFGPRNPNSKGHNACLQYLNSKLLETTRNVTLQNFPQVGYDNEMLNLTNLIASYSPEIGTRILLCAHWDTRPRADKEKDPKKQKQPIPGANDGASGVAVLLEIARLMKDNPPPIGVDILLVDGEDYGKEGDTDYYFLGSRYFIKNKSNNYIPMYGILIDLVGDKNLKIPRETYSIQYKPDLVAHIWKIASEIGVRQFLYQEGGKVSDDHVIITNGNIPCINIIDSELVGNDSQNNDRNYWHTLRDTPERCSKESLKAVGDVLVHFIYQKPLL